MRTIFVICALFACLALSGATETLAKARLRAMSPIERDVRSESAFLALKDTQFGKNLFAMLSLKFKSTGELDSLLNLLTELENNIRAQQTADDNEFSTTSATYNQRITDQDTIITNADTEINTKSAQKVEDIDTKNQKESEQEALETEQEAITNFLAQLATTRAAETESFNERVTDQNAMLAGLDEVIALFTTEVQSDANIDADTYNQVLNLLNEIRNSLSQSIIEDTNAENAAESKYLAFKNAQEARLSEIAGLLSTLATEIAALELEIENLQADIDAANARKSAAQTLKTDTQNALTTLTNTYHANQSVRTQQLTLLGQVRTKLTSNPSDVQNFLNSSSGNVQA